MLSYITMMMKHKLSWENQDVMRPQYGIGYGKSLPETLKYEKHDGDVNSFAGMQQKPRRGEMLQVKQPKQRYDTCCMLPLCTVYRSVSRGSQSTQVYSQYAKS